MEIDFNKLLELWREKNYTAYVRSLQDVWFINWDDKKSVSYKVVNDKVEYQIANFKPTADEIDDIRFTAEAIETQHKIHNMGTEGEHVKNHFTKNA